jgi:hypothetical protein
MAQKKDRGVLKEERSILYKKEFTLSANIHSNGFGVNYTKGKFLTVYTKRFWEIDFATMRHPKEYQSNSIYSNGQSYVYGKLNTLMVLRGGMGYHKVLFAKAEKDGVEIRYLYSGGLSLGIAKPIYYEIVTGTNADVQLKDEKFDVNKTNASNIYGTSSFFTGINETTFHPGLYGKLGLTFDYDKQEKGVKRIETGVVVDLYPQKVPILALIDNKQLFVSFYISFALGEKWNDIDK